MQSKSELFQSQASFFLLFYFKIPWQGSRTNLILTKPDIIKQDIVFKAGSRLALNRNLKVLFYSCFISVSQTLRGLFLTRNRKVFEQQQSNIKHKEQKGTENPLTDREDFYSLT